MTNTEHQSSFADTQNSTTATEASTTPQNAEPKRPRKRGWIVAGVIVAVIVVAGAGFWVWHEQPSFCNSVCHSPMDYYVETYTADDPHLGITAHANNDVACLNCHEAELTTQISEVMAWVSDSYPMTDDGTMLATGKEFANEEFCARSECHHTAGTTFDEITNNLWGFSDNDPKYNPHASHQDLALECSDCHGIHEANVLVCNECHSLNMPEGWEAPNEQ